MAQEPDRILYLAVPADVYSGFFALAFPRAAIKEFGLKLLVFDPESEEIVQWIH